MKAHIAGGKERGSESERETEHRIRGRWLERARHMRCHLNKLLLKYLKKLHQNSQKNVKKQQYKKSESSARLKKLKFDLVIREERNQRRSTVQEVPYYTI